MKTTTVIGKQPPRPLVFHPESNTYSVPLTKGLVAIIDASDYDEVAPHLWHAEVHKHTAYAARDVIKNGKKTSVKLHRELLRVERTFDVDHRDGNGLNNRRCNLRAATRTQNLYNQSSARRSSAGMRGAYLEKWGRYKSLINIGGKQVYLGMFGSAQEAHEAYLAAAKQRSSEFIYRPSPPDEAQ